MSERRPLAWDELDGRVKRNMAMLKAQGHSEMVGNETHIDDPRHGHVKVYDGLVGDWKGLRRCSHDQNHNEHRPCAHIALDFQLRGLIKFSDFLEVLPDEGPQLSPELHHEYTQIRHRLFYEYTARQLAAMPDKWFEGFYFAGGRPGIEVRAVVYAACVWTMEGCSMEDAIARLSESRHRSLLAKHLNHIWPNEEFELPNSKAKAPRPPFSHAVIWQFLAHPKTNDLIDKMHSYAGILGAEFDDEVVTDGTGFQIHLFAFYAVDRIMQLMARRKKKEKGEEAEEEPAAPASKFGELTVTDAGRLDGEQDEGKPSRHRWNRRRRYKMVVISALRRSGIIVSVFTEVSGEAQLGVPALKRAALVKRFLAYLFDRGYLKHCLSYYAHHLNAIAYVEQKKSETFNVQGAQSHEGKLARIEDNLRLIADPALARLYKGMRQKIESINAQHLRLLGCLLRCRGVQENRKKPAADAKGKPRIHNSKHSQDNEISLHYFCMNTINLVRMHVRLGGLARTNPGEQYVMWDGDFHPRFEAAAAKASEWAWIPKTTIVNEFQGDSREVVEAIKREAREAPQP